MAGLSGTALLIGLAVLALCLLGAAVWSMRRPADDSVRLDRVTGCASWWSGPR